MRTRKKKSLSNSIWKRLDTNCLLLQSLNLSPRNRSKNGTKLKRKLRLKPATRRRSWQRNGAPGLRDESTFKAVNIARTNKRRTMVRIGISVNLERALNKLWRKARPSNLAMAILKSLTTTQRRMSPDKMMVEYSFRSSFLQYSHGAPFASITYNLAPPLFHSVRIMSRLIL